MPRISVAMVASLRGGMLQGRNVISQAEDVKNTFSSWNNCMAKTYCKWPVIALIILAGLIVLSVVSCIIRCACCGLSCCCSCFSCFKCCGNCCGCCDDPKGKKHKHLDDNYGPPFEPQTGYKAPMPMVADTSTLPQYVQFETGPNGLATEPKKLNEDALPPMPCWETAQNKRILQDEPDSVEMGELDPSTGQRVPLMAVARSRSRSHSPGHGVAEQPYGDRQGLNQEASYMGARGAAMAAGLVGAGGMAMHYHSNDPYSNGRSTPMDIRSDYGNVIGGYPGGPGRGYDNQYDEHSYGNSTGNFHPSSADNYPPRGPPQRQYTGSSSISNTPSGRSYANERQYSEPPSSQVINRPYPTAAVPYRNSEDQCSPEHNSGSAFDFTNPTRPIPPKQSGTYAPSLAPSNSPSYRTRSPPQQQSYESSQQGRNYVPSIASSMPPSYRTLSPPLQSSYPGYESYDSPPPRQQVGGRGELTSSLMSGPRGGPRGYDGY